MCRTKGSFYAVRLMLGNVLDHETNACAVCDAQRKASGLGGIVLTVSHAPFLVL